MTIVPLSSINHYLYCPRRAAMIHVERVFVENEHTLIGSATHEHVDFPGFEQRRSAKLLRALPLYSDRLGLSGKADIVEVETDSCGETMYRLIEYKKGPKRRYSNNAAQLCAQALCLEEMFDCSIEAGAIFYAKSQSREVVQLEEELRELVKKTILVIRQLIDEAHVPGSLLKPQCEGCSLHEMCFPETASTDAYWKRTQRKLFEPQNL